MNVTLYSSIVAIRNHTPGKNKVILEGCANVVNPPQRQTAILHHHHENGNDHDNQGITKHKNHQSHPNQQNHPNPQNVNALYDNTKAVEVNLQRSNEKEPWGFRIQGGRDYRLQLSVKNVSFSCKKSLMNLIIFTIYMSPFHKNQYI